MKKIILIVQLFALSQLNAQSYYTGWDNATEINGWIQINKGDISHPYQWEFDNASFKSPDSSLAHYYPVGGSSDDWFISPLFDFSGGGKIDTLWKNYNGFGTPSPANGDTIALYLLNGSSDPDIATKTILYNFTDSTYNSDTIWRKDTDITIPATSGNSYIAFRYRTDGNWLDVKFDNLYITYTDETSKITETDSFESFLIYPNPTTDKIYFNLKNISTEQIQLIQIIDINGKIIINQEYHSTFIDASNLENGSYILKIETNNSVLTKLFQHKN